MQRHIRKLVTIITEAAIEKELIEELDALGVAGHTITDARGKGRRGDRSAEWAPEANIRIEIVCDERLAEAIAVRLKERYYENFAMIIFISEVEVLRPAKFG